MFAPEDGKTEWMKLRDGTGAQPCQEELRGGLSTFVLAGRSRVAWSTESSDWLPRVGLQIEAIAHCV